MSRAELRVESNLQPISLYPLAVEAESHNLSIQPAQTLEAISHSIENVIIRHHLPGTLFVGFQRMSALLPQAYRFRHLAALCREVVVFAHPDMVPPKIPNIHFVSLESNAPLAQEWFMVFSCPQFAVALLGRETWSSNSYARQDRKRYYSSLLSLQPELVAAARSHLERALRRDPAPHPQQRPSPFHDQSPYFTFSRMLLSCMKHSNRKLARLYSTPNPHIDPIDHLRELVHTLLHGEGSGKSEEADHTAGTNEPQPLQHHQLTVLRTDIQGFTSLSELVPLDQLIRVLNRYFDGLAAIVYQECGEIDVFMGDGMTVFFEDPHFGLRVALRMQKYIESFNKRQAADLNITLPTRISLVTGPCMVAPVGSRDRQEVTLMGDTVNVASRFQASSPVGGLVMDEKTYIECNQPPAVRTMINVRGKRFPLPAYEVEARRLHELEEHLKQQRDLPELLLGT